MKSQDPEIHWFVAVMVYQSYALLIAFGHMRDILGSLFGFSRYAGVKRKEKQLASLLKPTETFFTRRLYHRIQDCWNRPIASNPGGAPVVIDLATTVRISAPVHVIQSWLRVDIHACRIFGRPCPTWKSSMNPRSCWGSNYFLCF